MRYLEHDILPVKGSWDTHQKVDRLDDIQEDFILPVPDAFLPPGDSVGDSSWDMRHHL